MCRSGLDDVGFDMTGSGSSINSLFNHKHSDDQVEADREGGMSTRNSCCQSGNDGV